MQQGMLWSLLLTVSLLVASFGARAELMEKTRQQQWLKDTHIENKLDEFMQFIDSDDIEKLAFSLDSLAFPQQEVARYRLLDKLLREDAILSVRMEKFVATQRLRVPRYTLITKGDGYEFSAPAFDYPALANQLVIQWHKDKSVVDFVLQVEQHQLNLRYWLSGDDELVEARENLLLQELDGLTEQAVQFLVKQLTDSKVIGWLPSNRILAALARVSESDELYRLLWLARADHHTEIALSHVASMGGEFATRQLLLAARNPRLERKSIEYLTHIAPMPNEVETFFIRALKDREQATFVANALIEEGYRPWLESLLSQRSDIQVKAIKAALN